MKTTILTTPTGTVDVIPAPSIGIRRRALWSACAAHALHDGYTDLIFVLLAVWQAEFGLSYEALAILRASYTDATAATALTALAVLPLAIALAPQLMTPRFSSHS